MDLTALTDDQLRAIYNQSKGTGQTPQAGTDLSSLSDDQLKQLYARSRGDSGSNWQDIWNDAKQNAEGIAHTLNPMNLPETLGNLLDVGKGLSNKVARATGIPNAIIDNRDAGHPEIASLDRDIAAQKAQFRERSANALIDKFADDLGTPSQWAQGDFSNIGHTIVHKPVSGLMDLSAIAAPAAALPGRAGQVASVISNATNVPGLALSGASRFLRPIGSYAESVAKIDPVAITGRQGLAQEFEVPLTQGQQSFKPSMLSTEDNLRYARDGQARQVMADADAAQDAAIAAASGKLRQTMTGAPTVMDTADIGNALKEAYGSQRAAARARVSAAYDRAFDPDALAQAGVSQDIPIETVMGLRNRLRDEFENPASGSNLRPPDELTPNALKAVNKINQFSDTNGSLASAYPSMTVAPPGGNPLVTGIGWRQMDQLRKQLNSYRAGAQTNPADAAAMRTVMSVFDDELGKVNPLLNDARALHTQRMQTFEPQRANAQGVNPLLKSIAKDSTSGEEVYNSVFGSPKMNNGTAGPLLEQLRSVIGNDPQASMAIREGMLHRLFENAKTGESHNPKVAANNIRNALNGQGSGIYQSAFSPNELASLDRYGKLLDNVGSTRRAQNPSMTSYNVKPDIRGGAASMVGATAGEALGHAAGIPGLGAVGAWGGAALTKPVDALIANIGAFQKAKAATSGNTYTAPTLAPAIAREVAAGVNGLTKGLTAATPSARRLGLLALLTQQTQR